MATAFPRALPATATRNRNDVFLFCETHNACGKGRAWALANCTTMADAWRTAKPEWLLWIATRPCVLTDKQARLFACWCARRVWHLLTDDRSRTAIRVAERFARGQATQDELAAARDAAWAAAWAAAWDARDAAWDAARAAAWDARDAAWDAARAARAARDAARDAQVAHLRARIKNPFQPRGVRS